MSWSGIAFLCCAIANYLLSLVYIGEFLRYKDARMLVASELIGQDCELPGMITILTYSSFMVLPSGSFCVLVYLLTFLYKIFHLLATLICPISLT